MFSSTEYRQWSERIKFSTTTHIVNLRGTMRHPAYAHARRQNPDRTDMILALCDAELARRAEVKGTIGDLLPPYDNDLTRTTKIL